MPDGQERQPLRPSTGGPLTPRTWIGYLVLALVASWMLLRSGPTGKSIAYSEMKTRIADGQVADVRLARDRIVGTARAPAQPAQVGGHPVAGSPESSARAPARAPAPERWVAQLPPGGDPTLIPLLESHRVEYSGMVESDWLTSLLLVWVLPLGIMAAFYYILFRRFRPGAGIMSIGRSKARLLPEEGTGISFQDVAGVDEAVEELGEIVDFLKSPERFRRLGGRIPKGVLLVGPPGTGKTLLARAVAGEAHVPFFSLTGSDFVEMFVGVGAARVRDLFQQAQAKAPAIIFIDELDAIGKARGIAASIAGHDEREQTLNQLLAEMDGFDGRKGLIVMGATNRPEILDTALLRPGRFDRQVVVDRPDVRGREAILRIHARGVKFADVDLRRIAALTPGFAGAELANVINEGALLAARRRKDAVTMDELNEAVERVVAGLEKKNRRMNPHEKDIVSHHEAGHALLAQVLPTTDRVHKVSMIPRGLGALGYTMQVPLEDRYLLTRPELLDRITMMLGGRGAELLVFGDVSTGAQDDLQRASDLARRMVTQFGMSNRLGPQSLGDGPHERALIPGLEMPRDRGYSERTQELIDGEVGEMLRHAFRRAVRILEHNREHLLRLAARLRDKEAIEGPELEEVLAGASAPLPLLDTDETRWEATRH